MAITLEEIEAHLDALELKHGRASDGRPFVLLSFATREYVNPDGEKSARLVIAAEQEGRFFKLFSPNAYVVPEGPHREAVFAAVLHVSWKTKMIQFEYDVADGEVRAMIEFPVEDGTITREQLRRCVHGLVQILDQYHPVIQRAIDTGEVAFPDDPTPERIQALAELLEAMKDADPRELLAALRAARAAGGGGGGGEGPTEL